MNLYTISKEFIDALDNLHDLMEDGLEISEHAYFDTLEMLRLPLEEKAENIIKYVKSLEAEEEALKAEAKRLSEKAASKAAKAESLRRYLDENLKAANITNLKAGIFDIKYRKGSEVVEVDVERLPAQYFIPQDPQPMGKTDLKARLKAGEVIPGVSLVRKPNTLVIK